MKITFQDTRKAKLFCVPEIFDFCDIGWKSKITQKRVTLSISINKLVATGCSLEKGQTLCCYLAKDKDKRPVMLVYLDAKEKV